MSTLRTLALAHAQTLKQVLLSGEIAMAAAMDPATLSSLARSIP